jgi:hypothetical protein
MRSDPNLMKIFLQTHAKTPSKLKFGHKKLPSGVTHEFANHCFNQIINDVHDMITRLYRQSPD